MSIFEKMLTRFTTAVFDACDPKMQRDDGQPLKDKKPDIVVNPFSGSAYIVK